MNNLTNFIQSNKKHLNRLNRMIKPLTRHFHVDVFWHNTIQSDGLFTSVSSFHEPFQSFYEDYWFIKAGLLTNPKLLQEGRFFLDISGNFYKFQAKIQGKFPFHHPIFVQKKVNEDKIHQFGFASKSFSRTIPSTYLNSFPMFNQFIEYYLGIHRNHEAEIERDGINLIQIKGLEGFHGHNSESEMHITERNCSFLKEIGADSSLINSGWTLSKRQKQVLLGCVDGLTAAQTAKKLQLSIRTVEHYIDAVKDKLGVFSKKELMTKGRILKIAGLLND